MKCKAHHRKTYLKYYLRDEYANNIMRNVYIEILAISNDRDEMQSSNQDPVSRGEGTHNANPKSKRRGKPCITTRALSHNRRKRESKTDRRDEDTENLVAMATRGFILLSLSHHQEDAPPFSIFSLCSAHPSIHTPIPSRQVDSQHDECTRIHACIFSLVLGV